MALRCVNHLRDRDNIYVAYQIEDTETGIKKYIATNEFIEGIKSGSITVDNVKLVDGKVKINWVPYNIDEKKIADYIDVADRYRAFIDKYKFVPGQHIAAGYTPQRARYDTKVRAIVKESRELSSWASMQRSLFRNTHPTKLVAAKIEIIKDRCPEALIGLSVTADGTLTGMPSREEVVKESRNMTWNKNFKEFKRQLELGLIDSSDNSLVNWFKTTEREYHEGKLDNYKIKAMTSITPDIFFCGTGVANLVALSDKLYRTDIFRNNWTREFEAFKNGVNMTGFKVGTPEYNWIIQMKNKGDNLPSKMRAAITTYVGSLRRAVNNPGHSKTRVTKEEYEVLANIWYY